MTLRQSQVKLLPIKQFSQLCRTTPRTLRFYEKYNLIQPTVIDPQNKYRLYDPYLAKEFFRIKLLQHYHIPLRQIPTILQKSTEHTFLQTQMQAIEEEVKEKLKEYRFLKTIKSFLFEGKKPESMLKQEIFGPFTLLCTLDRKGRYDSINSIIQQLLQLAHTLRIPVTQKQMVFYLDPVIYKPKDTRLEICVVCKKGVATGTKLPKGYYFKTYPKTNVRTYTYKGPFEYIVLIYQKLHEEHTVKPTLERNELGFDLYISGPWNKKSEYDFVTKIAFPM